MGIKVKHDPSFDVLGKSAYRVGAGERRLLDRKRDDILAEEQRQFELKERGQDFSDAYNTERIRQSQRTQDFRQERLTEESNRRQAKQNIDQANILTDNELALRKYEEEPGRQMLKGRQELALIQEKTKWAFTEEQNQGRARLLQAVTKINEGVAEKLYTPEQAEKLQRQVWAKYNAYTPLPQDDFGPTPEEDFQASTFEMNDKRYGKNNKGEFYEIADQVTPQQEYNNSIVTDSVTGRRYIRDDKGNFEPLGEQINMKEYGDLWDKTNESMTVYEENEEGQRKGLGKPPKPEDVKKKVDEIIAGWNQTAAAAGMAESVGKQKTDTVEVNGKTYQVGDTATANGQEYEYVGNNQWEPI